MFKLVLEKVDEPEIKLPTSAGSWKKEERVRCMERVTWKLTLPYVKQRANRNLLKV